MHAVAHGRRSRFQERIEKARGPRLVELDVPVPGLSPYHDGLKIAHLTDLHVGILTPDRKILRAIERAQAWKPDLVLLTGDFVCYSPKFVGRLAEIVRGIQAPVYAVLGNHDYWTDGEGVRHALERNGYAVLRNGHSEITLQGEPLTVVGVDDAITGHSDVRHAFRGVKKQGSRIVLTHVPSLADRTAEFGPSLTLAGHTHGGHVNIPRVTAGIAARLGNRYLAGFFRVGPSLLYVNRGIGSSSVPIRAGAPSEVALFTLRPAPHAQQQHHHRH
jgi:predicted MPP superfamily phosphohydrolase